MSEVPWWAHSPSPMTLSYYTMLALYGAYKLNSKTKREWIHNFCESAFLIGMIILPFDSAWQLFQWLKFGYLYTDELKLVVGTFLRNAAIYALCFVSSWQLQNKTRKFDLKKSAYVVFPIIILAIVFLLVNDPGWSDWTYGMRYPSSAPWLLAYLMHLPIRAMKWVAYVAMWGENFINGHD